MLRGNVMIKMAAGSENESDDGGGGESITRTPAGLQTTEETFSQTSTTSANDSAKKVKTFSPAKSKTSNKTTPANSNSKSSSPSKTKRTTTPSKGKSVNNSKK